MLKVLVAEDNILLADVIEDFLVSGGYYVCGVANTIEEAVALADRHQPDLGVFDFRLAGGKYGSQILPRLQDKRSMGILFASGDSLENMLSSADGVGYIQKPYSEKELLHALAIVRAIKTHAPVPANFPKGFHLLPERLPMLESA